MKYVSKLRTSLGGASLAIVLLLSVAGSASAAPAAAGQPTTPPKGLVSGPQAKPPVVPDAPATPKLGPTEADSRPLSLATETALPLTGNVAGVDLQTPRNYCSRGNMQPPIKNTTSVDKSVHIRVYNQGNYKDLYTTVSANSTMSASFYYTEGAYTAYLYVWNGSSYVYDEYKSGTNTCNVSVTRVYNTGGWVQLKIQNLGTAFAAQKSSELAPYPASGTYTGTHYDYPVAGGAAIYRWFSVGTSPYGIVSSTSGSYNMPYLFSGDQ